MGREGAQPIFDVAAGAATGVFVRGEELRGNTGHVCRGVFRQRYLFCGIYGRIPIVSMLVVVLSKHVGAKEYNVSVEIVLTLGYE